MKIIRNVIFLLFLFNEQITFADLEGKSCVSILNQDKLLVQFKKIINEYSAHTGHLTTDQKIHLNNRITIAAARILESRGELTERFSTTDGVMGLIITPGNNSPLSQRALLAKSEFDVDLMFMPFYSIMYSAKASLVVNHVVLDNSFVANIYLGQEMIEETHWSFASQLYFEHELGHAKYFKSRQNGFNSIFHGLAKSPIGEAFPQFGASEYFYVDAYADIFNFEEVPLHFNDLIKVLNEIIKNIRIGDLEEANNLLELLLNLTMSVSDVITRAEDVTTFFVKSLDSSSTQIEVHDFQGVEGVRVKVPSKAQGFYTLDLGKFNWDYNRSHLTTADRIEEQLHEFSESASLKKEALGAVISTLLDIHEYGINEFNKEGIVTVIEDGVLAILSQLNNLN